MAARNLEELQKHGHTKFELEYIVMNPGYNEENANLIKHNAELMNIPITIFESNIFLFLPFLLACRNHFQSFIYLGNFLHAYIYIVFTNHTKISRR